jgi:hypothetical protein
MTKKSILTRMGIKAADHDLRLAFADAPHGVSSEFNDIPHTLHRDQTRHVTQTNMHRDKAAREFIRSEHHAGTIRLHTLSEDFGVARKLVSGSMHGFFVEGRGRNGVHFASESSFDAGDDVTERCFAAACVHLARDKSFRVDAVKINHACLVEASPFMPPIFMANNTRREWNAGGILNGSQHRRSAKDYRYALVPDLGVIQ